ncbi:MAG: hypothetical protein IKD04_03660 [Clostridia bacterium]|nr:hypothetical protein [Clostridia bacterium]
MDFADLRLELSQFYSQKCDFLAEQCKKECDTYLNDNIPESISAFAMKGEQYRVIAERVVPTLFDSCDFYYEVCGNASYEVPQTPGMWTYYHNEAKYIELNKDLTEEKELCTSYPIYTYCGNFGDELYHFAFENKAVIEKGFRGIYEEIKEKVKCETNQEKLAFYNSALSGITAVKRVAERFSLLAAEKAKTAETEEKKRRFRRIAETAKRIPWEKPETFYEALETVLFIQQVVPSLEGGLLCSVGRLDTILLPFYKADIRDGTATKEEVFRLISEFLLTFDLRIDHDRSNQVDSMVGAVYTLGGCDSEGEAVFNDLTRMFLAANSEQNIIYPKIKCRFSAASPKEYLELINKDVLNGKTTVLYVNDDGLIPAFTRAGVALKDARDYSLLGCWEPVIPRASNEHCAYMLLIRIFELSIYGGLHNEGQILNIKPLDSAKSFGEVLEITLANIYSAMDSRCNIARKARMHLKKIDPHPLLSCGLQDCIESGKDLTDGGTHYYLDEIIMTGLPNVLNSLLVIDELCFKKKKYTLRELLACVRNNWNNEIIRKEALGCAFYGDESKESSALARHITDSIARHAESIKTAFDGRVTVGYMLFMEMYHWSSKIRATPDGRRNGDFFERGLTPSALHHIASATSVLNSVAAIDPSGIAADSVVNINLPFGNVKPEIFEAFLRTAAKSSVQALQVNCVTKEELLDALENPEKHKNLIVRVCGYSAKFISLPKHVQQDFLQRNFFDR